MKTTVIMMILLFESQAFAQKSNISFDLMAILSSNYSLSYYCGHFQSFSIGGSVHYSNPRLGFVTRIGAPVDTINDVSVSAGVEYLPLANERFLKGVIIGTRLELGYAVIKLDVSHSRDSTTANGLFLTPTLMAGYRFAIKKRIAIEPQIRVLYNVSYIDFSNIGKFEKWNTWGFREDYPFHLTWDQLHSYRKGLRYQIGLKAGFLF